jgi:hypothetical protein
MKPIWHFTKSVYLPSIMASGTIFLEGYNTERLIRTTDVNRIDASVNASWKNLKMQYKLTGRYVWFTEEETLFCSTAIKKFPQTALLFDADEIEAKRWYEVIPTIVTKNKKAKKFVEALIKAAKDAGDNPSKWWITSTDVDIKFCKNL